MEQVCSAVASCGNTLLLKPNFLHSAFSCSVAVLQMLAVQCTAVQGRGPVMISHVNYGSTIFPIGDNLPDSSGRLHFTIRPPFNNLTILLPHSSEPSSLLCEVHSALLLLNSSSCCLVTFFTELGLTEKIDHIGQFLKENMQERYMPLHIAKRLIKQKSFAHFVTVD